MWYGGGTGGGWLTSAVAQTTSSATTTLGNYFGMGGALGTCTTSSNQTNTIMYVTMTVPTAGLYGTPTWTDQWTSPPAWSLEQDRHWQAQADLQMQMAMQDHTRRHEMLRNAVPPIAAPAVIRIREREEAQRTAAARARDLLLSYLSDDQRRTFEEHGWFIVLGGRSGRRYRISGRSYAGNVALLHHDNDNVEASFCGHCDASIPLGDQLLAQKVMLEIDEPAYIALANRRAA